MKHPDILLLTYKMLAGFLRQAFYMLISRSGPLTGDFTKKCVKKITFSRNLPEQKSQITDRFSNAEYTKREKIRLLEKNEV